MPLFNLPPFGVYLREKKVHATNLIQEIFTAIYYLRLDIYGLYLMEDIMEIYSTYIK
jgi:hypothetical protein